MIRATGTDTASALGGLSRTFTQVEAFGKLLGKLLKVTVSGIFQGRVLTDEGKGIKTVECSSPTSRLSFLLPRSV